jgi:hybrid polyketide synthase/nonribosomal peptide synthetase ACE1
MVKTYPTHIALKDGHGTILTYAQMSDRINTIATELVRAGVSEGTVVAVFQEPSADWTCSMLAIFRTGATYVPLDLKNGLERLLSSVHVAHPQVILADRWTMDKVSSLRAYNTLTIDVSKVKTKTSYPDVPNISRADSTAVILFTSGSTGVPKGIMLPHSCFVTHFEGFGRVWSDGPNVVLQQTTLSFDLSLYQIFTALVNGGTLCVVPSEKRGDPAEITKIMLTEGVTHSAATPTEYGMWFHLGSDNLSKCSAWSWALACGEALPKSVIRNFVGLGHSGLRLYNAYGPAEATFAITTGEIRYREIDLDQSVPTGYIFPNYSVYIMDENLKPVPVGVPGEIIAGGPGVASGYLGLDELTSEKFIKHPFLDKHAKAHGWDRLYRTGDRGHLSENGLLYYEGRIDGDTQIKLRGIRIELGEVENAIMRAANGSITQAVVSAHGETDSKFLVAYVVFSPQQAVEDCDQLLANLRSALPIPQNMRPSFFIPMESLPMNTHGKTDRKALSSIPLSISASQGSAEQIMLTDTEKRLSQLWKSILPSQGVEFQADADFFHVGGNSLLFIKLQRLVKEAFCAAPRLIDLMSSSDLRSMARVIESAAANEVIDWELETATPETWLSVRGQAKPLPKDNLTIVLTGATGYLGRHLLPRLVGDSRIYKIICLVRDKTKLTTTSNKISVFTCDLGEPNIGLSPLDFTRISEDADLIVHCAANRSFWDDYEVLRPVNFNAAKELTRMALSHCLPLHFFSSGAVSIYEGEAPPADGSDGYVTAKWASEKLLRNVAQQLSLPVCIHTPKAAPAGSPFTLDPAIIGDFVECAKRIGVRPNFEGFWGHLDLIETKQVVDKFCGTVLNDLSPTADDEVPSLTRVSYNGIARLDVNHAMATLNSDKAWSALPSMNVLLWMGEVKKNGFPYVLSSHHVTMSSGSKTVISRR